LRWYREAAEYAPDDPDIQQNLRTAQRRFDDEAARQLGSARLHAGNADTSLTGERAADQARRVFDTGGIQNGGIVGATVAAPQGRATRDAAGHVIVPPERMTRAIAELLRNRDERVAREAAISQELPTLNSNMHGERIIRLRSERATVQQQATFYDFALERAMSAAPAGQEHAKQGPHQ